MKIYLKENVQAAVTLYSDVHETVYSLNHEDIRGGSSSGDVRRVHQLRVNHQKVGRPFVVVPEEMAAALAPVTAS